MRKFICVVLVVVVGVTIGACASEASSDSGYANTSTDSTLTGPSTDSGTDGSSDSAVLPTDATSSSDGPCDGNPCIGDWQKEATEGGTVVQCSDGTWSHAGGISGACSDHGGESDGQASSASQSPPASAATQVPNATGGPCDGNPCIGDWEKEAAKGGTVVQCDDGTWSHAGGISGACSDHGGESAGGVPDAAASVTTVTAPDATSTDSVAAPQADSPLPVQCDANISGSAGIHCSFAENTFYEFYKATSGDPTQSPSLEVWSPTYHVYIPLACGPNNDVIDCLGTDSGSTIDVRFSAASMSAYTPQEAAAYAAAAAGLGPNG